MSPVNLFDILQKTGFSKSPKIPFFPKGAQTIFLSQNWVFSVNQHAIPEFCFLKTVIIPAPSDFFPICSIFKPYGLSLRKETFCEHRWLKFSALCYLPETISESFVCWLCEIDENITIVCYCIFTNLYFSKH